jgi:hypothetical protein
MALTNMIRLALITLAILCLGSGLRAQSAPTPRASGSPEEGFVSRSKYTNAFFGFSLPFPQDASLRGLALPSRDPSRLFLFGLQSQDHGVTALTVEASQSGSTSTALAKKTASGPNGESAKRIEINGKEFWKSESQNKGAAGKMRTVRYASALEGYVVEFNIVSFNSKLTDELEHSIEAVTFFDPAKAKEIAGADSQPYSSTSSLSSSSGRAVPQPSARIKDLSAGTVSGNNYTNASLGLSYQFPAGWYVADKATQEKVIEAGHEAVWGKRPEAAREHEAAQNCMKVLLWANKHPEGTRTDDDNPLIVVSAADPDCFPDIKVPTSSIDEETVGQVAQALVRSFQATPLMGQGSMKVGTLTAQGHLFLEVSGVSQMNVPGHPGLVEAHNSIVITTANNFWVIWVFSSGSEAGLQELKNTNITFSSPAAAP